MIAKLERTQSNAYQNKDQHVSSPSHFDLEEALRMLTGVFQRKKRV